MIHLGLSLGHDTVREAEHWLRDLVRQLGLPAEALVGCTHLVHAPRAHVAVSLSLAEPIPIDGAIDGATAPSTPPEWADAAAQAREEHAARRSGRAVIYPGVDSLTGVLSVAEVLARSAIDRVTVIGGPPPSADTLVDTRDFVRPYWMDGQLTLVTAPAAAGRIAPFEVPNPTPCCADHP